jgi:hypothetical protein
MKQLTKFVLPVAALFFALVLMPGSGWASVTNCPGEPKQGVPISSGETYFGANCVLNSASDVDSFTFNASAGDVWSMATAITTGGYPNNICLQLYAPGSSTPQFSGCSNSADSIVAVTTNQTLTVAGAYSIVVTETLNDTTAYGLSLERLSPAPPDGIPFTLGQTVTTALPAPTAQGTYTFYGTTSGIYKITSNNISGYPYNLCVALYQPNGSSALGPACTNSADDQNTVTENLTPTQTGTYVVVIYESGENATINYNLSVVCLNNGCNQQQPPCTLKNTASYNATNSTLTMNFTVGNNVATTWNAWLTDQNTITNLFSISQPITVPPVPITKTSTLSPEGTVGVLSTLTTPTKGIFCSSYVQINTGRP